MTFQYIAKDSAGIEVRGTISADDRISAIASIRANGLTPTALGQVLRADDNECKKKYHYKSHSLRMFLKAIARYIDKFAMNF